MCRSDKEGLESGGEKEDSGKKGHKEENISLVKFRKIKLPKTPKYCVIQSEGAKIAKAVWPSH